MCLAPCRLGRFDMDIWGGHYALDYDALGNSWVLRDSDGRDMLEIGDGFMLGELETLYDSTEGFCKVDGRMAKLLILEHMADRVAEVNPWLMGMFARAALMRV